MDACWLDVFIQYDDELCNLLSMCSSQQKGRVINGAVISLKNLAVRNDCAMFRENQFPCCVAKFLKEVKLYFA